MMGPDGIQRTAQEMGEFAATMASAIGSDAGQALFEYMKSVSTNRVMPLTGTSEALWHLEGQRHLVYLLNYWKEYHDGRQRSNSGGVSNGRNASSKPKRKPGARDANSRKT